MAGRVPEGAEDARRALALARELGYPAAEAMALIGLILASYGVGDTDKALEWAEQARRVDPAVTPDWIVRRCDLSTVAALMDAGQLDAALHICAGALARARDVGDLQDQADFLWHMAELDRRAGRMADAGTHLWESLGLAVQTGDRLRRIDCLDTCGHLCAAGGRWSDAITLWSAYDTQNAHTGIAEVPQDALRRQEPLRKARQALGPAHTRTAEERGGTMSLATAVEFATMLTAPDPQTPPPQGLAQLSARERELVTLVAQGHTDAQIADQLYISVSTVRSHLDRIRDKSGSPPPRRPDPAGPASRPGLAGTPAARVTVWVIVTRTPPRREGSIRPLPWHMAVPARWLVSAATGGTSRTTRPPRRRGSHDQAARQTPASCVHGYRERSGRALRRCQVPKGRQAPAAVGVDRSHDATVGDDAPLGSGHRPGQQPP